MLNDAAISESSFRKISEKKALIRCSNILKRGAEYSTKAADYGISAEQIKTLTDELATLENMQPSIGMITNDRKSAGRMIALLTEEARSLPDMPDDGLEGMLEDGSFLDGWFAIRKIKGRRLPKIRIAALATQMN